MRGPHVGRHPVARGFDRVAETYERGRPGYPEAAIGQLVQVLGLGPGRTVVDLGCGTGKLTRQLRATGVALVGVEPSESMRSVFARAVPDVLVVAGTAEAIPLPDGLADAVVVAQAFHWFRARSALREIARVLRPGGTLALLWNVRDRSEPLGRELDAIVDRRTAPPPGRWRRWEEAFRARNSPFGPLRARFVRHRPRISVEAVVQHLLSVSRVAWLRPAARRAIARETRAALLRERTVRRSGTVRLATVTEVYWARRRSARPTRHSAATKRSARTSPARASPRRRTAPARGA